MAPLTRPGNDANRMRELAAVLELVRTGRASTRGEIVSLLNLRSTSVSDFVGELVEKDLLRESTPRRRGRGRPAALLTYNAQRFGAVVLQVTGRRLIARAVDMGGRIVAEHTDAPPQDSPNDAMATTLARLAGAAAAEFPAGVEVVAVVCSLSGLLDARQKRWCFSSRWPQLHNLDIEAALRPLGHAVVLVRNIDAELTGRLADLDNGHDKSVLLLHWGHGIGAAYYTEGEIVNRTNGRFCEIGHWQLGNGRGAPCACGSTDCLETVAGLWALRPRLEAAFPGIAATEPELLADAMRFDLLSVPEVARATSEMVRLTSNLSRLLFPDRIIVTGPFVHNSAIFARFKSELEREPVLRAQERMVISAGEAMERFETAGALTGIFEAARERLIAG
ncbi:MAG: hypothetical protein AcusKO_07320 [Acuticoccus sp.]